MILYNNTPFSKGLFSSIPKGDFFMACLQQSVWSSNLYWTVGAQVCHYYITLILVGTNIHIVMAHHYHFINVVKLG